MPSLPVNPSRENMEKHFEDPEECNCNFHFFLRKEKESTNLSWKGSWLNFGGFLGLVIILSLLVMGLLVAALDVISIQSKRLYEYAKLIYLEYTCINILNGLYCYVLLECMLIDIPPCQSWRSKLRHSFLPLSTIIASVISTILTFVFWYFRNDLPTVPLLAKCINCGYTPFHLFYLNVFGLMAPCVIVLCLYQCWSCIPRRFDYELQELQELRISISNPRSSVLRENGVTPLHSAPKFCLVLCALVWVVIFSLMCSFLWECVINSFFFMSKLTGIYVSSIEQIYIILLVTLTILKWTLKKISRKIDTIRLQYPSVATETISFELISEFIISIVYWDSYRYLFTFENFHWTKFFSTKLIHVISELFEAGLVLSKKKKKNRYTLFC
ncbi:hypothetical protein RFI_23909 [Reticulomyxa filosa]|uniref:Uncharacterized protein n=1 Tax=Reticulomyxa filosa TaxID=46433 RepID=X6MK80_RETFI|nr:hypothetical protein RFI_23909 [Reticulomyxa filosa]|eukprot:ETO13465.1 hypothetical protein RFI_23909 [Reticulomyxa filosa]